MDHQDKCHINNWKKQKRIYEYLCVCPAADTISIMVDIVNFSAEQQQSRKMKVVTTNNTKHSGFRKQPKGLQHLKQVLLWTIWLEW